MAGKIIGAETTLTTPVSTDTIPLQRPGDTTARHTTVSSLYDVTASALNVKEYGALGDGITDDTAAIQSAIDSVGATTYYCDLELYFPEGTYLVTSSIDLTDKRNVVMAGAGGGYNGYGTTKILSQANGKPAFDLSGSANISMRDITIYGDSTNSPSCGILLARTTATNGENSAFNTFRNVFVTGYYTVSALYSWSSELNKYDKCMFENLSTSGKCVIFFGGRNRYSITSDYVTFSATVSSVGAKFEDCSLNFYNATSPDAIVVLGDHGSDITFDGGYANSDLSCPCVEAQGDLSDVCFRDWYVEAAPTSYFSFTLYSGAGTVYHFTIDGGGTAGIASGYFIDQVASHVLDGLYVDHIRSRGSTTSDMRFQGTLQYSVIRKWWIFTTGTISFNNLYFSEVWYYSHTITVTSLLSSELIKLGSYEHWLGNKRLQIGTEENRAEGELATVSEILTKTTTWDPGSLADGESAATTISLTTSGISTVDQVVCMASLSTITNANWQISAFLVLGPSVRVVITNHTGGVVDLGSGTLRVVAMKVT